MLTFKHIAIALAALVLPGLCSCSGTARNDSFAPGTATADTLTHHARYLTMSDFGNGATLVEVGNPWDKDKTLARYMLVERDSAVPEGLPADIAVIPTPVRRMAAGSAVHTSALEELGAIETLAAVTDAAFFPEADTVHAMIAQGAVVEAGTSEAPSAERLAAAGTEVLLRSPMQSMAGTPFHSSMVPVEMADYMETTPIARAEWILLLGCLTGKSAEAKAIFEKVMADYSDLALRVKLSGEKAPKVLTDTEYTGVWYVPAGKSYQARLLADAGADYPWADTDGSGSLALSLENVADAALDADLWLVRSLGYETTPESLKAMNPRYTAFKAWKNGDIYSCNSTERLIFNDMAFHPEKILAEYTAIFHPALMPGYELKYFKRTGR